MEGNKMQGITSLGHATELKLQEMWQENTGIHLLDSGGTSNRKWQRNQKKTLEQLKEPAGYFERDYHVFFNTFAFLLDHVFYTDDSKQLTEAFRAWVDEQPKDEAYYNSAYSVEEFLLEFCATPQAMDDQITAFNTYNWDTYMDAVLQVVPFVMGDTNYSAISYHGGMDVRGGYTDFVIFESCDAWLLDTSDISLWCRACGISADIRGMHDLTLTKIGEDMEPADDYDVLTGCPECKGDWEVHYPECQGNW